MNEKSEPVSRGKTPQRVSSPDQLTDYLRVTNPGIWVLLACVILLLTGIFAWASIGTLETVITVKVRVEAQTATVIPLGSGALAQGMPLRVSGQEFLIDSTSADAFGRVFGVALVTLPDGVYDGTLVTEQTRPISFLLESR